MASPQTRLAMARRRAGIRAGPAHLAPAELERARGIHRIQLRRAVGALALLGALIIGLPLLLALAPWLDDVRVAGVPVSWLAVGVLPYAVLVALAGWQLRRAEGAERQPRSDPAGSDPAGSNPGSGPAGSGPAGSGPAGSGPAGSGPAGSGPAGSGPASSGPARSAGSGTGGPG